MKKIYFTGRVDRQMDNKEELSTTKPSTMAGITIYLSTIAMNANVSILQSKHTYRLVDLILKNKIQPFVAYRKCTSLAKMNIGLK
jgi:hypothetical protein